MQLDWLFGVGIFLLVVLSVIGILELAGLPALVRTEYRQLEGRRAYQRKSACTTFVLAGLLLFQILTRRFSTSNFSYLFNIGLVLKLILDHFFETPLKRELYGNDEKE